jgi:hypothetical protein
MNACKKCGDSVNLRVDELCPTCFSALYYDAGRKDERRAIRRYLIRGSKRALMLGHPQWGEAWGLAAWDLSHGCHMKTKARKR